MLSLFRPSETHCLWMVQAAHWYFCSSNWNHRLTPITNMKEIETMPKLQKHLAIGPSFLSKPHLGDKRGGFTWAIGLQWSTLVCRCLATLQLKMHLEDESQLLLVKLTQKATKNNTRINKKRGMTQWLIWFSSLEHVQHGDFYIAGVAGLVLLYGLRDLGVTEIPTHMSSFSSQPK